MTIFFWDKFLVDNFLVDNFTVDNFTDHSGQKPPRQNKCWNLEILQDNSKALAGRCLEEQAVILKKQKNANNTSTIHYRNNRTLHNNFWNLQNDKKAPTTHMSHTTISKNDPTLPNQKSPSLSKKRNHYSYLHTIVKLKNENKMTIFFWDNFYDHRSPITGTKAPRYNKCWSLEILQDNSKALAGRCLEEQ